MTASAAAYSLRASLRAVSPTERERACGIRPVGPRGGAGTTTSDLVAWRYTGSCARLEFTSQGRDDSWDARWTHVLTCGHVWTCPVCSSGIRTERIARATRAMRVLGGRWQMVTLTLAHARGDPLAELLAGMLTAWRKTRQGGALQDVWTARVSASVRATEIKWSPAAGWHPHVHALLRTTDWDDEDRATLAARWRRRIVEQLGEARAPDREHGIRWSRPVDLSLIVGQGSEAETQKTQVDRIARYIMKLGLEVYGVAKGGRGGRAGMTHWRIAESAAAHGGIWRDLWCEYVAATKGRRMVEMDDRMKAAASARTEDGGAVAVNGRRRFVSIDVTGAELRALRLVERRRPAVLRELLTYRGETPDEWVRERLTLASRELRHHRG